MKNTEILRQIDDAASQLGSMTIGNKSTRVENRGVEARFRSPMETRKTNSDMYFEKKQEKSPPNFRN